MLGYLVQTTIQVVHYRKLTMSNTLDTNEYTPKQILSQRVGDAHDMLQFILNTPPGNGIPGVLWGALSGVETVLQQARDCVDAIQEKQP